MQLALAWTSGSKTKDQAKDRFVRAFDGSDLSSYDVHRKSDLTVKFDDGVKDNQLSALPVKRERDVRPADLEANSKLLDGGEPMGKSEWEHLLGGIELHHDSEADCMVGLPSSPDVISTVHTVP